MAAKKDKDLIAADAETLYLKAAAYPVDEKGARSKVFFQDDLVELAELPDLKGLMPLVTHLQRQSLFRPCRKDGKLGWSVRSQENARQIAALEQEERPLYEYIEEAHDQGIWQKSLKNKTNLAQNTVTKALSKMEKCGLIKGVKSIKNPAQRIYMLAQLKPSEDVTGNSFFDAGDLDESFRDELMNLIVFWVRQQSWVENKRRPRKESSSPVMVRDETEGGSKKRKRATDIEDVGSRPKFRSARADMETDFPQLIYRAGSHNYPTAEDIHQFLTSSDAIKPTKAASLTVPEIQGCIDVLCWDEKLEKVPNKDGIVWGYRTVRGVTFKQPGQGFEDYEEHPGTGFTQAPCGRCPVFDLCHEDGPVNPQECVYFEQWLKA